MESREESSPPTAATPRVPSPLNEEPAPPSSNTPEQIDSRTEARDYFNGGESHPDPAPVEGSETKTKRPSVNTAISANDGNIPETIQTKDLEGNSGILQRSIQFAQDDALETPIPIGQDEEPETPGKSRGAALMSKLKAFANTSGLPTPKIPGLQGEFYESGSQSLTNSPTSRRTANRLSEDQSDADLDTDADIETADEAAISEQMPAKKKQRKIRRFRKGYGSQHFLPNRITGEEPMSTYNRLLRRRASMPDTTHNDRGVQSDVEGRDKSKRKAFRRGHSFMNPSEAPSGEGLDELENSTAITRRHTRRITVFGGGGVSDGDALTPRRNFFTSERASTYGVQKWKQVKNTLKLLRQKKDDRFDYFKSAELMAELRAGAPAVLMLASMIQRDEHGNKRIPVLLEQLKLKIKDSCPMPDDDKERHWIFTIELEYGSGPSRMNWTVIRTIRDIYNLHFRYRFALNNDKYMLGRDLGGRPKQPKFPYSAFPYLRGARNKDDESEEEEQASDQGEPNIAEGVEDPNEGAMSGAEGPPMHTRKKSRSALLGLRRRSTGVTDPGDVSYMESQNTLQDRIARRQRYIDKQRRILEKYLSEMIRWLMFRADSNRLCRFLELSALGVRLAAEGSYHGKEGFLHIQTSKGLDFRRVLTPAKVIARHSRKWFLVRQSYIVCVESPENMNIYDVYLVDSKFKLVSKRNALKQITSKRKKKAEVDLTVEAPPDKHHTLTLYTAERKVRLFSRYQSVMRQFEDSINSMLKQTPWYEPKRFDSFAPVRNGVFAQWLVDGRDYMWNVSRAINMARDVIYIHDWWLSPELYMRRPSCISQKWRLDRLLQKKAREGVKVFVIIYRNVEAAVPIDSEYTKFSLLNLHPNIFVQRSPNQFKKNQFFFAHHEKICIVDHDVAFLGGIDLCFGRWDCPQHPIVDDKPTGFEPSEMPKDSEHVQLFPGKDYSNPRVQDFFRLNEPYEEMYDRSKVPRMPWHDVGMQVVGQPARDLTRHFVQRWNYLRRGRKSTRPLPFLLPAPDAKFEELEALGLTGTCEVQILRSASEWSIGIEETEKSIQNAYVKMIEDSDHFVYMENQFFITSTEAYGTRIVNRIGDALVDRIKRAHENEEDWRCVIVIPLMPGFQNTVDEQEGSSVRLIVMCQYRSICRGEHSIFGCLRAAGIEPEDYISFYSLRQWGIMANDVLATEQLYIHAKAMIVDDRVALIGSANINERSMLGNRDSEVAAIVRDTDMIWSTMAGKPYRVGRFAHTLRLRLMREHLGLDVDEILEDERDQDDEFEEEMNGIYGQDPATPGEVQASGSGRKHSAEPLSPLRLPSFNHDLDIENIESLDGDEISSKGKGIRDSRVSRKEHQMDLSGYGPDHWKDAERTGVDEGRDSVIVDGHEVLLHTVGSDSKLPLNKSKRRSTPAESNHRPLSPADDRLASDAPLPPIGGDAEANAPNSSELPPLPILDDANIGGPAAHIDPATGRAASGAFSDLAANIKPAVITKNCMRDPIHPDFIDEVWNRVARNNTVLYRKVFRCMPDSKVGTWPEYRDYMDYYNKFRAKMEGRPMTRDSEFPRDGSHSRATTSAGIGISAPGPEVVAQIVEAEAEKMAEKVTDALSPGQQEDRLKVQLPDENDNDSQEKHTTFEHQDLTLRPPPGDPAAASSTSLEPPSPVYAPGDVPFPVMETSPSKGLGRSKSRDRRTTFSTLDKPSSKELNGVVAANLGSVKRRRRGTTKGSRRGLIDEMPSRADAEELLKMIQGNVVEFPYDWLQTEENNGNWGYQVDGVAPIAIYN